MDCTFLTCVYSYPEFLYIQHKAFNQYLKQSFTFIVVDDSIDLEISTKIRLTCNKLDYQYIRCPQTDEWAHFSASNRHARALNLGWKALLHSNTRYIGVLDTDLFPTSILNLDIEMKNCDILAAEVESSCGARFFWPGFSIFRSSIPTLEEIRWDVVVPYKGQLYTMDTGAATLTYIEEYRHILKIQYVSFYNGIPSTKDEIISVGKKLLQDDLYQYCIGEIELAEQVGYTWRFDILTNQQQSFVFFHFRNVSNWIKHSTDIQMERIKRFNTVIESLFNITVF